MESKSSSLPINGTDYIEFYVGNAKQAAHYYQSAFGFQPVAYAGLETGLTDRTSYVVRQDKITFVLTAALTPNSDVAHHHKLHGDGVKVIALWVDDARKSFKETTEKGAEPYFEPKIEFDEKGEVVLSGIKTYGDTVHIFVERQNYNGSFLPGFTDWEPEFQPKETGLMYVDHIVGNVGWNEMDKVAAYYSDVMGFKQLISFDDKDISTEFTALKSKVMANDNMRVKFPINEPAKGLRKSQVEEYLDFYKGPGSQHVALATNDIVSTIQELRARGVDFLHVPDTYYDSILDRVGEIEEDIEVLRNHHILIDRDDKGYLLQLFTKPVEDRPTFFFEIIQRKNAISFGKGNFQALFEAIELEQQSRGTL
ncbi:MAG: 4-hydroxyphenylpyruvate dioxygenase [Bacteroidetes bacterium]|jgi:4-hydroxyphenylpyruvate dioxygenase|nr:4-hydroxyphenylpyruvate dioxygenase [Bacteroidota bacterium]|tara:strand:+ start:2449 stop:3549 length:1101 start_codon:yes stop_codon:yes gene_type:complete